MSDSVWNDPDEVDVSLGGDDGLDELEIDLDMTGVARAGAFKPAPEGDYSLLLEDIKLSKKVETGNISISAVFTIFNNPDPDIDGTKIFHSTLVQGPSYKEKSKKFVKAFLDAISGTDNTSNVKLTRDYLNGLVGNICEAHVKVVVEPYKGVDQEKNKIAYFLFGDAPEDEGF